MNCFQDYSYEYKNTVAESHGAFDPELKEAPKLESASTKEGPDTPTARQLTIEQKEELMEFFCYSACESLPILSLSDSSIEQTNLACAPLR